MAHDFKAVLALYNAAQHALMHSTWEYVDLHVVAAEKTRDSVRAIDESNESKSWSAEMMPLPL